MKKKDKFLLSEICIEFKAALYFYSMLFFYIVYRLISGSLQLEIFTVLQMLAATYIMCFVQVYLLGNFDEAERFGRKEAALAAVCSLVYAAASWLLGWYGRGVLTSLLFFAFMLVCFGCTYWLYSFRRSALTRQLNCELETFKRKKQADCEKEETK